MSRNVMRLDHVRGNLLCSGTGAGVTFVHFERTTDTHDSGVSASARRRRAVGAFVNGAGLARVPSEGAGGSAAAGPAGSTPSAHGDTITLRGTRMAGARETPEARLPARTSDEAKRYQVACENGLSWVKSSRLIIGRVKLLDVWAYKPHRDEADPILFVHASRSPAPRQTFPLYMYPGAAQSPAPRKIGDPHGKVLRGLRHLRVRLHRNHVNRGFTPKFCRPTGLVGCEIGLCAFVRPRVPCVPCVSRLPRCLFTGIVEKSVSSRNPHQEP